MTTGNNIFLSLSIALSGKKIVRSRPDFTFQIQVQNKRVLIIVFVHLQKKTDHCYWNLCKYGIVKLSINFKVGQSLFRTIEFDSKR